MDGWVQLTPESFKSHDGIEELNRMLRIIFDNLPGDADQIRVFTGYGTPLNNIQAKVGSLFMRQDGGANTTLYVKESASDGSGWVAK